MFEVMAYYQLEIIINITFCYVYLLILCSLF